MKLLILLVSAFVTSQALTQLEIIEHVNSQQTTWKAGVNFKGKQPQELKYLMGTYIPKNPETSPHFVLPETGDLPENFDSRENWPNCETMNDIRDQSDCGSCWAFGAAEAMSDRICVKSGAFVRISPENLLSCCSGLFSCGFGCNGGMPTAAWKYWKKQGIVTGWLYNTTDTCQPYVFPPCAHHINSTDLPDCGDDTYKTPACSTSCISQYSAAYDDDLHFGESHYTISLDNDAIQKEIYANGPVEADFTVYEDFLTYTSGVYQHTTGAALGGHAIKMLGWGVEDGTPYWLCANSWNAEWGDKGYFKILRGSNECGIENDINAGIPK